MADICLAWGCEPLKNGTDCPRCGAINSEDGGAVEYDPERVKEVVRGEGRR